MLGKELVGSLVISAFLAVDTIDGFERPLIHLHFARRYNGVWIAADDPGAPLDLDGWIVKSSAREYDGWMVKDDVWLEAWDAPGDINAIRPSP